METIKTNAIVVRAVDYGENDKILTLVSIEDGKLTAVCRGVKKQKARLKYASAPFSFGEYMLATGKGGRYTVADCMQEDSFFQLTADIGKYYAGFILLELLDKLTGEQPNPSLVVAVLKSLNKLTYGEDTANAILAATLVEIMNCCGYGLNFDSCANCGRALDGDVAFDFSSGMVCARCASVDYVGVNRTIFQYLRSIANNNQAEAVSEVVESKAVELLLLLITRVTNIKLYSTKDYFSVC